uniref:pentatricopeptide repeat-containing protein At5g15010, mitochondrial n=1 Tax=Erigeron canadensis TaxID=72917 RepID=UPI001CB8F0B1|nr:pentatricopeptide repeat-containing protein At5g15010, mitochondrial [Erigeron canadensis]
MYILPRKLAQSLVFSLSHHSSFTSKTYHSIIGSTYAHYTSNPTNYYITKLSFARFLCSSTIGILDFDQENENELKNHDVLSHGYGKSFELDDGNSVLSKDCEKSFKLDSENLVLSKDDEKSLQLESENLVLLKNCEKSFELESENILLSKDRAKRSELESEIELMMETIRPHERNLVSMRKNLEKCGVPVSLDLVTEVLARVRNDWEVAFTFFLWAGEQEGYAHCLRQYHSMIAILGKMRRFDTAWGLIDEMKRGGKNGGESMVTPQTLLIMIRRYCAVHDVGKAVNTFYAYKQFGFRVGVYEFHDLLSALCHYKNVKEAEALLMCNKDVYPLNTKSFNIVLNGWYNVIGSPREGKRLWWEMCNRGICPDVISYSSVITCYSKSRELKEVMKVFNELVASDIHPDRKIYNAVIHALAKSGLIEKARELMSSMEEKGISPNAITYNSLIMPLCKAHKSLEARKAFDEMLQRGLFPSVRTYHGFFQASKTAEDAFWVLQKMNKMGCRPSHDTYIMLTRKFCRWGEMDNVWKLWNEMISNGLDPDRSSYVALINGLFLNGKLEEAYEYHVEMKTKGLLPEPEIEERLEAWMAGKRDFNPKCNDSDLWPFNLDQKLSCSVIPTFFRMTTLVYCKEKE